MAERIRAVRRAVLVCGLIATGCGAAFVQPQVRFDGLRIGGLGILGGTVYARLHVVNPNRYDLATSALTYDLELAAVEDGQTSWSRLASGTFAEPIRVDGRDSVMVEIPIEFSYADMGGALRSVLDRGTFDYRVSGIVSVSDPVRRQVPYRRTGTVAIGGAR